MWQFSNDCYSLFASACRIVVTLQSILDADQLLLVCLSYNIWIWPDVLLVFTVVHSIHIQEPLDIHDYWMSLWIMVDLKLKGIKIVVSEEAFSWESVQQNCSSLEKVLWMEISMEGMKWEQFIFACFWILSKRRET